MNGCTLIFFRWETCAKCSSGQRQTEGTHWPGAAGADRSPPGTRARVPTVGATPLAELIQEKQARVSRVLDHVFPEQRYLREQNGAELERIPVDASERDIREGYGQVWCTGSGGGLLLGVVNGLAIAEPDAPDELTEAVGAVEPAPVALGRLGELEDHGERGLA